MLAPGEIPTKIMHHLADGSCKTIDQLDQETQFNRRQISDGARQLILRDYAERIETGCYQLTETGLKAAHSGLEIKSGPISKDRTKLRKSYRQTLRQRAWRIMRMGESFTVQQLTMAAAGDEDQTPENNLQRYIRALCQAGYLIEMRMRQKGTHLTSNGFKRFKLIKNTGPQAPVVRRHRNSLFDRNINEGKGGEVPCR